VYPLAHIEYQWLQNHINTEMNTSPLSCDIPFYHIIKDHTTCWPGGHTHHANNPHHSDIRSLGGDGCHSFNDNALYITSAVIVSLHSLISLLQMYLPSQGDMGSIIRIIADYLPSLCAWFDTTNSNNTDVSIVIGR
jgi:hypothetical protein